jgi:hypothetical protein
VTRALAVLACLALLTGCVTNRSRFTALGPPYPPRAEGCQVEIFRDRPPERAFVRVARLDVHIEWSLWTRPSLEDAEAELKRQACLAGADAVIDLEERRGAHIETKRYHVTATGIKYRP